MAKQQSKNIKIVCRIENREDREYLFLLAQSKYLEYEKYNGKGGMISDKCEHVRVMKKLQVL